MQVLTSWPEWERWAAEKKYTLLPYVLKSDLDLGLPVSWENAWQAAAPYSLLLENGKGGRYTYLGLRPVSVLKGKGAVAEMLDLSRPGSEAVQLSGAPLDLLRQWIRPYRSPALAASAALPPFTGGVAGFLGYDVARSLERLPSKALDQPGFPDYVWLRFEQLWIYDHAEQALYCAVYTPVVAAGCEGLEDLYQQAAAEAEAMLAEWRRLAASALTTTAAEADGIVAAVEAAGSGTDGMWPGMSTAFAVENFQAAVRAVQEYIRQGDVFQVNLSLRQEAPLASTPEQVYEWLRKLNPSPYMGLLRSPGFALSSASPELLVKLHGDKVSARPIAGTRRRGHTPAEDAAMEAELRGSEKEIAEHIMLVDLERNDVGRVAAYGTVRVPELMTVERYSHVMHLVSQVEGIIAPGKDAYDVIAAMFPGGTITGAPKVRTMEIIEELEPVRRGPYTGSMGWIDYSGDMELNIVIRTLAVQDGIGYIQTGAGIVIDSDPYREYRECHNKAKAVVKAVLCSEKLQELRNAGGAEGGATR
ncbi:anthranilate synthase component I family protein [Paenibacillus sp. NFR01]|uniref:anthranilate synthase component I family protein n=1 Tax=Paenibacillus sp. NFR01 TaxID=1566279 RepID=UPI0008AEB45B|nr:anthranilate synthase component I family protein [Paenibacillus sp. NFR01]SEU31285.1 para-aminobenzoate synthetase component 1 [Paenibacillus sp. NFR01]